MQPSARRAETKQSGSLTKEGSWQTAAGFGLGHAIVLLGAATIACHWFKRLGSACPRLSRRGLAVDRSGLGLFNDPETLLHTANFGVVMFLFIIGLEMRPSKLVDAARRFLASARPQSSPALSAHAGRNGGEPQLPSP